MLPRTRRCRTRCLRVDDTLANRDRRFTRASIHLTASTTSHPSRPVGRDLRMAGLSSDRPSRPARVLAEAVAQPAPRICACLRPDLHYPRGRVPVHRPHGGRLPWWNLASTGPGPSDLGLDLAAWPERSGCARGLLGEECPRPPVGDWGHAAGRSKRADP